MSAKPREPRAAERYLTMRLFSGTSAVGLDIGQSTVKAVLMVRQGRTFKVEGTRLLDCRKEGIIDAKELRAQLPDWLSEAGWRKHDLVTGIPQYLTTTQVSDFPPGSTQALESMVAYETQQLAGLSEDRFVHDYCVIEPGFGRNNPVLIGVCRYSVVAEHAEAFLSAGLHAADFGIPGLALANAYSDLYPDSQTAADPQLLLDIGTESSTVVIVAMGRILFMGSLLFGAHRYTQALAKHLKISETEAEAIKLQGNSVSGDAAAPMAQASRILENELRTAIEHWRTQCPPELREKAFGKVCLSGGGALLGGLAEQFQRFLNCPAEVIGLPLENNARDPRFLMAYGLALQGIGLAQNRISLAPDNLRWLAVRRRNFRYLAAACGVLLLTLAVTSVWMHQRLTRRGQELRAKTAELERCSQLIPQLEDVIADIGHQEKMLVPVVAKANRNRRFLAGLDALSKANMPNAEELPKADSKDPRSAETKGPRGWFIYFADADSYRDNALTKDGKETEHRPPPAATPPPAPALPGLPGVGGDIGVTSTEPEFPNRYLCTDVPILRALMIAGYTPVKADTPFKAVRDMVEAMNRSDVFANVDLFNERGERDDIFRPWVECFRDQPRARYKAFILQAPYATLDVVPSKPAERRPRN